VSSILASLVHGSETVTDHHVQWPTIGLSDLLNHSMKDRLIMNFIDVSSVQTASIDGSQEISLVHRTESDGKLLLLTGKELKNTRSSAVAERPRDASCR